MYVTLAVSHARVRPRVRRTDLHENHASVDTLIQDGDNNKSAYKHGLAALLGHVHIITAHKGLLSPSFVRSEADIHHILPD